MGFRVLTIPEKVGHMVHMGGVMGGTGGDTTAVGMAGG
jgi:hypothetical protein